MKFEFMIAARHLTSRRGRGPSLVGVLAIIGVAIGVAATAGVMPVALFVWRAT